MTDRITKAAEERIVRALESAKEAMDEGLRPNDAIVKAATALDLPAGHVRLMVQAYNTAQTNNTRRDADDVFEKAGEFELADSEEILSRLFPKVTKSAGALREEGLVSDEYSRPPAWYNGLRSREKAASGPAFVKQAAAPYAADPGHAAKKAHAVMVDARRQEEELRRQVSECRDKLANKFEALENYFRSPGSIPFEEVTETATALWGKTAAQLLAEVGKSRASFAKTAGYHGPTPAVQARAPWSYIRGCLNAINGWHEKTAALDNFRRETRTPLQKVARRFAPPPLSKSLDLEEIMAPKQAAAAEGGGGWLPSFASNALGTAAGTEISSKLMGKPTDALQDAAFKSITDPAHEARIKSIQTQAALHDMLANDPVISGHQPEDVLKIYNEVQQMAPRVAQNSMLMRALIRKHLAQGSLDPFDLTQITGIESNLKSNSPSGYQLPGAK